MPLLRIAALALVIAAASVGSDGQGNPPDSPTKQVGTMPMHHPMGGMTAHGQAQVATSPAEPDQAALGAIQEIVRMLQSDQMTDWSKVDIDALRQHLIDMDEVTLRADAQKEPVENGLRMMVTGSGRTLEVIQRMMPAHAQDINCLYRWSVQAKALPNGEELIVTGNSATDAKKIRALGFMAIMVLGTRQMHHLAMANAR